MKDIRDMVCISLTFKFYMNKLYGTDGRGSNLLEAPFVSTIVSCSFVGDVLPNISHVLVAMNLLSLRSCPS